MANKQASSDQPAEKDPQEVIEQNLKEREEREKEALDLAIKEGR